MNATLILSNVGSFVLGLIVMRWAVRRGLETATTLVTDTEEHSVPQPTERITLLGTVALVTGLILFGLGVRVGYQLLDDQVQCFDSYANQLADSQETRQAAVEKRDDAIYDVFRTTRDGLRGDGPPAAIERDLSAYLRTYDELEAERAANPYPDAPREVC